MSFIDKLFPGRVALRQLKALGEERPPEFIATRARNMRYNLPDYTLAENQQRLYQMVSWIHVAVKTVANGCALQPFNVLKRTGEETEQIYNHDFEVLLRRPNELQTRYEFLFATSAYLQLTGNAYWWLNRVAKSGPPSELYILPTHLLRPILGGTYGTVDYYEWDDGSGTPYNIPPTDICHFKYFHPNNMFTGMGQVEPVAIAAEKDFHAQKYDMNFFASDKGKPDAILGIKGRASRADLEALRRDLENAGRGLAVLENTEQLAYIQLALNYLDMEFLQGRQFTKEEIYAVFAPGLASVLDVNATEANSRAGQETLTERAIYPQLVAIEEGVTNRVLPLYGDNLHGEFEDPRRPDRLLELQELAAYAETHTVDEIRQKHYGDDPIGDERGELLIAQIGQALSMPGDEPPSQPIPPQFRQEEPPPEDEPPPDDTEEDDQSKAIRDELKAWRSYELRRVGKTNTRPFETRHIPVRISHPLRLVLDTAESHDAIKAAFEQATQELEEPEEATLNFRLEDQPLEPLDVPPITEEDMQAAYEWFASQYGQDTADQLMGPELEEDDTANHTN